MFHTRWTSFTYGEFFSCHVAVKLERNCDSERWTPHLINLRTECVGLLDVLHEVLPDYSRVAG
jgi:hypothetical protein